MSFDGYKETIEEGDLVILYISFDRQMPLEVKSTVMDKKLNKEVDFVQQTSYGALRVKDLLGKKFGVKFKLPRGYIYVLHPTPELWTRTLPHRTQILYATDISVILHQLDLKPGSKGKMWPPVSLNSGMSRSSIFLFIFAVIECGTGSGSLSHSLIRTISPDGHLYTFDFHQSRLDAALAEFRRHRVDRYVTAARKDACHEGFGDEMADAVDAVFLDLPHPWDAIGHAKKCLRRSTGGRLCSFSPCIEQVQKTIEAMKKAGFKDVRTLECLLRPFQVRRLTVPDVNLGSLDVTEAGPEKGDDDETEEPQEKKRKLPERPGDPGGHTFVTAVPNQQDMAGHTGFLTFATLPALHHHVSTPENS